MTEFKSIRFERDGDLARIVMNRPPLNVMDIDMIREINNALESLAGDRDAKLLVFSAEGKAFSAGVEVGDHTPEKAPAMIEAFNGMFLRLAKLTFPTLAVVRGAALGGGCEVVIFCDMIVASEKAKFGQPEVKLGFFAPLAEVVLPRLVGRNRAIELLASGRTISAEEAERIGLINACYPEEGFDEKVEEFIGGICRNSPLILRFVKRVMDDVASMDVESAIHRVGEVFLDELMKTEDTLEGLNSFFEKRKPVWKNR